MKINVILNHKKKCPFYQDLRMKHLSSKFVENPNVHKFVMLLSSNNDTVIFSIASFIHSAWLKRKLLLAEQNIRIGMKIYLIIS